MELQSSCNLWNCTFENGPQLAWSSKHGPLCALSHVVNQAERHSESMCHKCNLPSMLSSLTSEHWCQKPHQSPNVGPDVVSYHIYHYVTRPTSVEKEHSFQVHFMFRVEPGRKIWVDGDLANCLVLRVHLQVLCWISEYSEQRRSDKMSRNQKTRKRSRIAVFCWATGISARRVLLRSKWRWRVSGQESPASSHFAACKHSKYVITLWACELEIFNPQKLWYYTILGLWAIVVPDPSR